MARPGRAVWALSLPLALASCGGGPPRLGSAGPALTIECVPYARTRSGIELRGDAAGWWDEAAGRYRRSSAPQRGAVLVFRATRRLPSGHVSVVAQLRSAREIIVDQANWVHGHVGRTDPVLDVSPDNDWSAVRVWWAPSHALGNTVYPTYGFVLPEPAGSGRVALAAPTLATDGGPR